MIRRLLRNRLPKASSIERYFWARPFKRYLAHPNIWAINRRSVAGGISLGLFTGLIPGPFQVFGSVVGAVLFRVNLPTAVVTTFYTNPLTIVPLYVFAVAYGNWLLGGVGEGKIPVLPEWDWSNWWASTEALLHWGLNLGPSLAVGLPATMLTLALVGYCAVRVLWNVGIRISVVRRRRRRLRRSLHDR